MKSVTFIRLHATLYSRVRRQLYRQVLLPAVAYASPVWWSASPDCRLRARINTVQRTLLLTLTGAYRTTRTEALQVLLDQPPLDLELDRLNAEFVLFQRRRTVTYGGHTYTPADVLYPRECWREHPSEARGFGYVRLHESEAPRASTRPGTHVFTDGSFTSRSAGAAVVVLTPRDDILAVLRYRLSVASSAYCAEVLAFKEALSYVYSHAHTPPYYIYSDSLSLLTTI
ncbi:uncharacterized protein LOC142563453 [Dermacentor variabilis]|uniref:uncharacterized protein LOC142563453 n=1 Tax=Dermacentor variabilis TaxID=34621 RepID=UPI003F5C5A42